jgi:FtsP/CotA-like multicopper oxidase with cupredoxin domain
MTGSGVQLGAVLQYQGAPNANPTSTTTVVMRTTCDDEASSKLIPFVPNSVPTSVVGTSGKMEVNHFQDPNTSLFRWLIDGSPHIVDWNEPSLKTVLDGGVDFGPNSNIKEMPGDGWYLWWIQSTAQIRLPHPIHLHGHDFYILGSGIGTWDGTTTGLNFENPTRRDTATLPAGGYLLMAFPADNPGMWIMHCHIAWHASQGLSMQFMERRGEISSSIGDVGDFRHGCDEWDDFWYDGNPNKPYNQTDSGI